MKADVFDSRRCFLGEGPTASGMGNNEVMWVDIDNSKVLSRNLKTGISDEFDCKEPVAFAIPRKAGGQILGTTSTLKLRDLHGAVTILPIASGAGWDLGGLPIRWNDAKVSPQGNLWLGNMTYEYAPGKSALYRLSLNPLKLERVLSEVTISNGLDWSDDGKTMFYIDSPLQRVEAFTVIDDHITERRTVVEIDAGDGAPDGMCMDAEGGLWVALWGGGEVRRFDTRGNFTVTDVIEVPSKFVTSCAFAGDDLRTLIITSAHDGDLNTQPESGMTFMCKPGFRGRPTTLFPA